MGRRLIIFLTALFFLLSYSITWSAQIDTGVITTACAYDVAYTVQDPSCPEEADGYIELEVLNANGLVTMNWIDGNGSATSQLSIEAGDYKVELTDTTGCIDTLIFTLNDPLPLLFDLSAEISCLNVNNGVVTVSNIIGVVDSFSIDNGPSQLDSIFTDLESGFHTVQVYDSSGCYYEETIEVPVTEIPTLSFDQSQPSCAGHTDATLIVIIESVSNSETYEYSLDGDNYSPDSTFNDLPAGTYEVFVRNEDLCVFTDTLEISDPDVPVVAFDQTEATCPGGDDATLIVIIESVSNSAPYLYSLDGNNYLSDSTFTNLEAGTYEVFVQDTTSGCVTTAFVDVDEPVAPIITTEIDAVTCPGGDDATLIVIIESVSNTQTYEYSIDGNVYQQDSIFSNLDAGEYEVFIQDTLGCLTTELFEVEEPATPIITTEIDDVTCPGGDDATLIVIIESVSNTQTYEYSIDGNVYQQDSTFSDLDAGEYEVFIQDTLGCLTTELFEVEEPVAPIITTETDDVTCPGGDDATLIVIIESVSNSAPYQYSIDGNVYQTDTIFTDLNADTYTLYAQDTFGCEFTQLVNIEEPELPSVEIEVDSITCPAGDDATLIVIIESVSNSATYLYSIDGNVFQSDTVFANLSADTYTIYVQDTFGCEFNQMVEVEDPEAPEIEIEVDDVTCPEGMDGSFIVIIESVSTNFNYQFSLDGNEFQEDSTYFNQSAGLHNMVIRDERACIFTETLEIFAPTAPTLDFEIDSVTCSGGDDASLIVIIESVSNSAPYLYSIDGNVYQADSTFANLGTGIYEVFIKDSSNCVSSASLFINEPDLPEFSFQIDEVTCPGGGDASLIINLDDPQDFDYSLDGNAYQPDSVFTDLIAGVYTAYIQNTYNCVYSELFQISEPGETELTVSSADLSCPAADDGIISVLAVDTIGGFTYSLDGINFQDSSFFENLGPGIYEVTVKNGNECLTAENAIIIEPDMPEYDVLLEGVSCNGGLDGSITVNLISGITPFTYALDTSAYQNSNVFENLGAGLYTLNMLDSTGCAFSSSETISEPPPLNAQITPQNETCNYANGWVAIAPEGGTSPYDYFWDIGETNPAISGLEEGTYRVSITDNNNCLLMDSIVIENEAAPVIQGEQQSLYCFNDQDGWIELNVISDSAPLVFDWSNGEASDKIDNLSAGEYGVTVTDRNNCHTDAFYILGQPDELQIVGTTYSTDALASVDVGVVGGEAPYTFEWSNGEQSEDLNNVVFGFYELTVIDANGCEAFAAFNLLDPDLPVDGAVNVYPTLATSEVHVDIQLAEAQKINLYLVDELGRIVQVLDPEGLIDAQIFTFDLDQLGPAIYFLKIEIGEKSMIRKVVKVIH